MRNQQEIFFKFQSFLTDSSNEKIRICSEYLLAQVENSNFENFDLFFDFALNSSAVLSQRAARAIYFVFEKRNDLIPKYEHKIFEALSLSKNYALDRSLLRIYRDFDLPVDEENLISLMNLCMENMNSQKQKIANKGYSLLILEKIAKKIPELIPEIELTLETTLKYQPTNLIRWVEKVLKSLRKSSHPHNF